MPAFKIGSDPRNDWLKWRKAFERFIAANGVEDDVEKLNLLLVLGGIELQTYYDKVDKCHVGVPTEEGSSELRILQYESAILTIEKYFAPQLNKRFERHQLRALKQELGESFEDFVFRLKEQAKRCKFYDTDDMVVDQIIEGCSSVELRKKLLTEEKNLTEALMIGRTLEEVLKQTRQYGKGTQSGLEGDVTIHKIGLRQFPAASNRPMGNGSRKCYNCGRYGHIAKDIHKCAAAEAKCHNCGTKGHYKFCCRKRRVDEPRGRMDYKRRVQAVIEGQIDQDSEKGVFHVSKDQEEETSEILNFDIGGVRIWMVVDSGSPANILQESTYRELKECGADILNERSAAEVNPKYEAFASEDKICFSTAFEAEIKTPNDENGVWAHFLVAPKGQTNLLSKATAYALGVLKIGYNVNKINEAMDTSVEEFPKVPEVLLKIQIDPTVEPVAQAARRLPIAMEADVEQVSVFGLIYFRSWYYLVVIYINVCRSFRSCLKKT